jgi:hypothetical protein
MSVKARFGKACSNLSNLVLRPFKTGKEFADTRPPARKIRKHTRLVRVEVNDNNIELVVPKALPEFRRIARVDVEGMKGKTEAAAAMREIWATGANWGIAYVGNLRRSEINPVIKIYKTALKLEKAQAKAFNKEAAARKDETEGIRKDPMSGIQAIPPTLSHARGRVTEREEDMGGAAASPA